MKVIFNPLGPPFDFVGSSGGGSGSPGGDDGSVQLNDGGSFGGVGPGTAYQFLRESAVVENPPASEVLANHPEIVFTWTALTDPSYPDGDVVVFVHGGTWVFAAEVLTGDLTGAVEPTWSDADDPGETITDGDITWTNVGLWADFPPTPTTWQANHDYDPTTAPRFIYPTTPNGHLYIAYPLPLTSGGTEPDFNSITFGNYISDNDGYWMDAGESATPPVELLWDYLKVPFGTAVQSPGEDSSNPTANIDLIKLDTGIWTNNDEVFIGQGGTSNADTIASNIYEGVQIIDFQQRPIARLEYGSGGNGGTVTLFEQPANGSNFIELGAPASIGATKVWTLPTVDVTNGLLQSNGSGVWLLSNTITAPTLAGAATLAENASIALDPAGSADGKYSGITVTGTAGTTLAFGDLIYLAAADSRWELVDADSVTTCGAVFTGMCVLAAAADGSATTILLTGIIRADANFPALTIGSPIYASTTPGKVQTTAPSGTDDVVQIVGYGMTADEMYFDPSKTYLEV